MMHTIKNICEILLEEQPQSTKCPHSGHVAHFFLQLLVVVNDPISDTKKANLSFNNLVQKLAGSFPTGP